LSKITRFYSKDLLLRVAAVNSSDVISEMVTKQNMGRLASAVTGRALTGAALMAAVMREGQAIGIHFKGDGVLGSVYAEASYEGHLRGWCDQPQADLPVSQGLPSFSEGVGRGFLYVTRSQPFERSPHVSTVEIQSGEVGDDIAFYLHQSHQIPSVVALGSVSMNDGEQDFSKGIYAGGMILELMPGASEALISKVEDQIKQAKSLTALLRERASAEAIVANFLPQIEFNHAVHDFELKYQCRCNMERVERSLVLTGKDGLNDLMKDDEDLDIKCEFCGDQYKVTIARLRELVRQFDQAH
jgi:molecular chaperone Hsp33